jgi:hypothetical protein
LNCLRCDILMELGSLWHQEQIYPMEWSLRTAEKPITSFRLLGKDEAAEFTVKKIALSESRAYVDAYRCPNCGYVELSSTRKLIDTDGKA